MKRPVEIPLPTQTAQLNVETIQSLDRVTRPTQDEVLGMMNALCVEKRWSRDKLAALLCITKTRYTQLERKLRLPDGPFTRLVWLLYTLNKAPELAMNLMHFATWGKSQERLPSKQVNRIAGKERLMAKAWLRGKQDEHQKLTLTEVARHFEIRYATAKVLCVEAGYTCARETSASRRTKRTPHYLKSDSYWLRVDWRSPDFFIAHKLGLSKERVANVRLCYRRLPMKTLRRHLLACGISDINKKWRPIFKFRVGWRKPGRKLPGTKWATHARHPIWWRTDSGSGETHRVHSRAVTKPALCGFKPAGVWTKAEKNGLCEVCGEIFAKISPKVVDHAAPNVAPSPKDAEATANSLQNTRTGDRQGVPREH